MGHTPHGKTHTSDSLRSLAKAMEDHAKTIRQLAEEMDRNAVKSVYILHGRGIDQAVRAKFFQFTADARKKIDAAAEKAKASRKKRK